MAGDPYEQASSQTPNQQARDEMTIPKRSVISWLATQRTRCMKPADAPTYGTAASFGSCSHMQPRPRPSVHIDPEAAISTGGRSLEVRPRTALIPPRFPVHAKALDEPIGGFGICPQPFGPCPLLEIVAPLFDESRQKLALSFAGSERVVVADAPTEFGKVVSPAECLSKIIDRDSGSFHDLGPHTGERF